MEKEQENTLFRAFNLIAILFVVDGHIPIEGELFNFGGLFRYYSFHLMMFAFSSGYFFKEERKFKKAVVHDFKRSVIPLYIWNCIYGIICLVLSKLLGTTFGEPLSVYSLLIAPFTDGQHFVLNLGAWFIGALFLAKFLYRILYFLCSRWKRTDIISFIISVIVGCGAVTLCRRETNFPIFLLRPMILLPGYAGGVLYHKRLESLDHLPVVPYLSIILGLRFILCAMNENLAYLLSNCSYFPCNAFSVYAGAALAIAFYLRIARLLNNTIQNSRILLFASRHTFDIMMHHGLGIFLANGFFLILNILHLGAKNFSVSSWRTQGGYAYAPDGRPEYAVLYLAAGLLFSLMIACLTEKLKKQIQNMN